MSVDTYRSHAARLGAFAYQEGTMKVELGPFYKGVACGTKVHKAQQDVEFANPAQRTMFFWLGVGMLAAGEYGITDISDVEFFTGAATRAPAVDAAQDQVSVSAEWLRDLIAWMDWYAKTLPADREFFRLYEAVPDGT